MPHLFDELKIRSITLRNRIGVSPMCQYSCEDGKATDWHLVHLGSRAVGGAGLVIAEATAVETRGRISPNDAGIWSDEHIPMLARITSFIKAQGAIAAIQLAHAGRKASAARPWEGDHSLADDQGGWETIGPSSLEFGAKLTRKPKEMTQEDIIKVREAFCASAERAEKAGYQWLELHFAHGYLVHSFLSPLSNKRTDNYGGSFENRTRIALEITRAVRAVWPEKFPLAVRLSCSDWVEGGWTIEESVELSSLLKREGVDLIDCSSGFGSPDYQKYPFGAGFQVPFSERIRKEAAIATATVGFITSAAQADEIIRNGRADIVLLAREMLRNPYWPVEAAKALNKEKRLKLPIQYSSWV